jgi:DNA-binding NarL/FixJ family response regulator
VSTPPPCVIVHLRGDPATESAAATLRERHGVVAVAARSLPELVAQVREAHAQACIVDVRAPSQDLRTLSELAGARPPVLVFVAGTIDQAFMNALRRAGLRAHVLDDDLSTGELCDLVARRL